MIANGARVRLTAEDFDFIASVLAPPGKERESLVRLLVNEAARDEVLDLERLADAILDSPEHLRISPHLLFYVLCRKVLRDTSVASRDASDYVAAVLGAFSRSGRIHEVQGGSPYISDMLAALAGMGGRQAFLLRSHLADYALFVSGIFADHLERRSGRGAPNLAFYERVGEANYRVASAHSEAKRCQLDAIYDEIARGFREVRLALNSLATRFLHLEPVSPLLLEP
jgi:hypothetical protein